jgi:hypothetical protein
VCDDRDIAKVHLIRQFSAAGLRIVDRGPQCQPNARDGAANRRGVPQAAM